MRVPRSLLPETLSVEPFLGSTAYGPKYGAAATVRARVEGRRRAVRKGDGSDVIASATATIRPEDVAKVPVESRATWVRDGVTNTYEVADVLAGEGLTRPAFYEVLLA